MDWLTSYSLITIFVVLVLVVFKVHFFLNNCQCQNSLKDQAVRCPTQFYLTQKPFVSGYLYRKISLDQV
jgi:hypothetical protein